MTCWTWKNGCAATVLALVGLLGCGGGAPPGGGDGEDGGVSLCRCRGEVPGGYLDVLCGESVCLGGRGYRCTDANEAEADPAACRMGGGDGGVPTDAGGSGSGGSGSGGGGSCSTTCDGCCDGERCLGGTSRTACGAYGEACVDCGPARLCEYGSCVVDPASRWSVILVGGTVDERTSAGTTWDALGGLPDAYALVRVGSDSARPGRSSTAWDTLMPYWNEVVVESARADALMAYVGFAFYDEDVADHDPVGSCAFSLRDAAFEDGTTFTERCGAITFTWSLRRE